MVEEGEEIQSQETELETEEEAMPVQTDVPSLTDAGSSQEASASQTETTPSQTETTPDQTGAGSNPETLSPPSESTATMVGPEAVAAEADTPQDTTSAAEKTK